MAKDNIKKLTTAELVKQDKLLDKQEEFVVAINGVNYKLTHDVIFRKTKQHSLLDDLIAFFNAGSMRDELYELATPYTALLILKHFTSLEVSEDIDEALALLQVLIDLEALDKLLNNLPEEEVLKIYELIATTVNNLQSNIEESEKEAEMLSEQIQNKEVKEWVENGKEE